MQIHLLTVGHGSLDADAFNAHLRAASIAAAADVRRSPAGRQQSQFDEAPLTASLAQAGIAYVGFPELGDRRSVLPQSANTALRNGSFRAYADHMQSIEFGTALVDLLMLAADRPTVMFCTEPLWWRCHRRLIADAIVLLYGGVVTHLVGAMQAEHVLTPGVRRDETRLVYDGRVQRLS